MYRIVTLIALTVLGGCATPPFIHPQPERAWQNHRHAVAEVTRWELQGRIAVHTEEDGINARLHWQQQDGQRYDILLQGPLGRGVLRLQGEDGQVLLSLSEEEQYRDNNAENLLYTHTGLRIPFESLYYWVRGLPVPSLPHQHQLDAAGRLKSLQQGDWQISFLDYIQQGRWSLPRKLYVNNHRLKVKLVISDWGLTPSLAAYESK